MPYSQIALAMFRQTHQQEELDAILACKAQADTWHSKATWTDEELAAYRQMCDNWHKLLIGHRYVCRRCGQLHDQYGYEEFTEEYRSPLCGDCYETIKRIYGKQIKLKRYYCHICQEQPPC